MKRWLVTGGIMLGLFVGIQLVNAQQGCTGPHCVYIPVVIGSGGQPDPNVTMTATATSMSTATATPTRTNTNTPTVTNMPTNTATSTNTPTSTPTNTPTPRPMPLPNGGFEEGDNGVWMKQDALISNDSRYARTGTWFAWFGSDRQVHERISQRLTVPNTHPYLSFWYTALSFEFDCYNDAAYIRADPNPDDMTFSSEIVGSIYEFCDDKDHSSVYWYKVIDLNKYAGQRILLEFDMSTDWGLTSLWQVDDVEFVSTP